MYTFIGEFNIIRKTAFKTRSDIDDGRRSICFWTGCCIIIIIIDLKAKMKYCI